MIRRLAVVLVACCAWLAAARGEDGRRVVIFPQLGHSYPVMALAYSPDGTVLATGSADKTIKLWNIASGRELRSLTGHTGGVLAVAFSPDGRSLASAGADGTVRLWDVASGRALATLTGHTDAVMSVSFSPDGESLASSSADGTTKIWDVAHAQLLTSQDGAGPAAYSPDGKAFAWGRADNAVALASTTGAGKGKLLIGHTDAVGSLTFSRDGQTVAAGGMDKSVVVWDAATGQVLNTFRNAGTVMFVALSPDGRVVAFGGGDNAIALRDVRTGRELATLHGSAGAVTSAAFSPDGLQLASANWGHTVDLWSVSNGRLSQTLKGYTSAVEAVAVSPDSKLMASASWDHSITLWDMISGRRLRTFAGHEAGVMTVAFSPDGALLTSGGADKTVRLWEVASGRLLRTLEGHGDAVNSVAFSPDGRTIASGSDDHTIRLWDAASGALVRSLRGHTDAVESVAFSPDGTMLASASDDRTVRLWRAAGGAELRTLTGHTDWVNALAFSPNGKVLASGGFDDTIRLWDAASGRILQTVKAQSTAVNALAYSPNGRLLASAGSDKTTKLWNVADGGAVRTLAGHTNSVNGVAFTPDGKSLVSAGIDGTSRVWNLSEGRERVALVAFTDASFVAITPEGFFDSSSEESEDHLNVRIGDRVFGIGSFREYFYRPDLVRLGLAGMPLAQFGNIDTVKLPPVVELMGLPSSTSNPTLKLTVRVTNGGGGIGIVRVFWRGTAIVQDGDAPPSADVTTRSYSVPLFDGGNDLRVTASNAEGSAWSDTRGSVDAALPLTAGPAGRSGTLYALVIGIQDFPKSPSHNLRFAVSDAQLFLATLRKYSAPLFKKLDVTLLTAPGETDKAHVEQALKTVRSKVGPNDEFVFYVASHGVVSAGRYYLITSNVGSAAPKSLEADAVSGRELTELLANIPVARKLVIVDTCDSEALGDALQQAASRRGMSAATAATILSRSIGLTVLSATATDQEAIEGYKDHGLFTYVVADGLAGKAADLSSGVVNSASLADYVGTEVPSLAQIVYRRQQQPTTSTSGQSFAVTKVK